MFVFADDGLNVFPSLGDLYGWLEAPDVDEGVYEAIFSMHGDVIRARTEGMNVILTVTGIVDLDGLERRLRAHEHEFLSDPADRRAVANEMLRRQWDARWPQRPRWLARRLHGDGPPEV